jgi:hypothetical protein
MSEVACDRELVEELAGVRLKATSRTANPVDFLVALARLVS